MPSPRLALFAVLLAAVPAVAATRAPPTKKTLRVPVQRLRLANGLRVILHEDHRLPVVAVNLWFRVGSKDERPGRTGFAHLFEHLMFMGTKEVPNGQFDGIMEQVGGFNNASTSEDRTNYFELGPSNLLETFLWLEADRLATLPDAMTAEKVDLQRDVVKNERRQSYENRPYGAVELTLPERMYPEGHPYHHPAIGSHADLSAASVDDVKQFFRAFYVPANASLVVSGDFRTADARRLVEKHFARLPKAPEPPHAAPKPVTLEKGERVVLRDAVKLERATLAWHSPPHWEPGDAECDLLAAVLGIGKSSRLHRALVYEKKLAQQVQVEQRSQRHGSLFVITATAQPGHTAVELERAIEEELARLGSAPPTPEEVERARSLVETQTLRGVETPLGLADALNAFEYRFGDAREIEWRLVGRYGGIDAAAVARAATRVLGAQHLTIHVVAQ